MDPHAGDRKSTAPPHGLGSIHTAGSQARHTHTHVQARSLIGVHKCTRADLHRHARTQACSVPSGSLGAPPAAAPSLPLALAPPPAAQAEDRFLVGRGT